MTTDCDVLLPALAARAAGLPLDDAERADCEAHLARCASCPGVAASVEAALCAATLEARFAPDSSWERLARGLEEERARERARPDLRVLLACTFCHGSLDRREAAYCASCLAPHHGECFETHGRCGATGCSETATVAPRETAPRAPRRRARWPWVLAVLGPAGAVAALAGARAPERRPDPAVASPPAASAPTVAAVPSRTPPPDDRVGPAQAYPSDWSPPTAGTQRNALALSTISVHFQRTPFPEAIDYLRKATGCVFIVSADVQSLAAEEAWRFDLEADEINGWDALFALVSRTKGVTIECNDRAIRLSTSLGGRAVADPQDLLAREAWKAACTEKLAAPVRFEFDATPIGEVAVALRALTGVRFGLSPSLDASALKVTMSWPRGSASSALTELAWLAGIDWDLRDGGVFLAPRDEIRAFERCAHGPSNFADLRGGTVPDLVALLQDRVGVDVLATRRAWSSKGTLSLVIRATRDGVTGGEIVAAIHSQTALRASVIWAQVMPRPREVLILDGEVPGIEEARTATPHPYRGVAAQIAELRARLAGELAARAAARLQGDVSPEEIGERERRVAETAARILTLVRRSHEVAGAAERSPGVRAALVGLSCALDVEAPRSATVHAETAAAVARFARDLAQYAQRPDERLLFLARVALDGALCNAAAADRTIADLSRDVALRRRELAAVEADVALSRRLQRGERLDER